MNSLAQHHRVVEQRDEIKALKLALAKSERRADTALLDLADCKALAVGHAGTKLELKRALQGKSRYKAKWRLAVGDYESLADKARRLIKAAGKVDNVLAECGRIGKIVGLKPVTVRNLWYGA